MHGLLHVSRIYKAKLALTIHPRTQLNTGLIGFGTLLTVVHGKKQYIEVL